MSVIIIDDYPSILSRICKIEQLYDFVEHPIDSGKSAYVYKAKRRDQLNVVVRITNHPFEIEITPIEWFIKDRHFLFLNTFPQFFPHVYNWGVISMYQEIINTKQDDNVNYMIRYEILEYVHTEPITKTSGAIHSLYRFLYDFWTIGFTHGDLTIRNIRYTGTWRFIDLDSVLYKPLDDVFPFLTPIDFYSNGNGHRDHNNFTVLINSVPEWKSIVYIK